MIFAFKWFLPGLKPACAIPPNIYPREHKLALAFGYPYVTIFDYDLFFQVE
jgi:hypothetical protein